jgi:hypothetical protein
VDVDVAAAGEPVEREARVHRARVPSDQRGLREAACVGLVALRHDELDLGRALDVMHA